MQFDLPDQHAARAFRMNKRVPAARVAERMSNELATTFNHLCARLIQIVDLEADMMEAGAARCKVFAEMGSGSEWPNDFKTDATIAFEIVGRYVLIVNFFKPGRFDSEQAERRLAGLKIGRRPGNMLETVDLDHFAVSTLIANGMALKLLESSKVV